LDIEPHLAILLRYLLLEVGMVTTGAFCQYPSELGHLCGTATIETSPLSPIDCAQFGLDARAGARVSSNVNGTTACASHVCGKTGARQIIAGNTEYGACSWAICGWTWNSGLSRTVASWAIAAEAKINVEPAARANCKELRIVFLRRSFSHASDRAGLPTLRETSSSLMGRQATNHSKTVRFHIALLDAVAAWSPTARAGNRRSDVRVPLSGGYLI